MKFAAVGALLYTLSMGTDAITYHFSFLPAADGSSDGQALQDDIAFEVKLDRESTRSLPVVQEWTALSVNQCDDCPFASSSESCCPPAVDCADIVERFAHTMSVDRVRVTVELEHRTVVRDTDMQTALGSLLGLIMATSGCPILSQFKGMAHFHLPFASTEETLYRTVGAYLLKQYFAQKKGHTADLELARLKGFYDTLQRVNDAFMQRVRNAAKRDANLNALVILFSTSALVGFSLENDLDALEPFFG